MESPVEHLHDTKIKKLLKKFVEPNFKIERESSMNALTKLLSGNVEIGQTLSATILFNQQIFIDWILEALTLWETKSIKPVPGVAAFTVNLLGILSRMESVFIKLNSNDVFERLIKICELTNSLTSTTVKLAYVKCLTCFLNHKSGIHWTMASTYWRDVLKVCLVNESPEISVEGHKFIAKLLCKAKCFNKPFCITMVEIIMEPLNEKVFMGIKTNGKSYKLNDEELHKILRPTLLLISGVLEIFMEDIVTVRDFTVILIFLKDFKLDSCIENYLTIAQSAEFVFDIHKILYIISFFNIAIKKETAGVFTTESIKTEISKMYNIYYLNITRGFLNNVMKIAYLGQCYWKNVTGTLQGREHSGCLEHQLCCLQFLPLTMVSYKLLGRKYLQMLCEEDELRDDFTTKVLKGLKENTLRLAFLWKRLLVNQPNVFENARTALMYIVDSRIYFTRDIGAIMFQCLIYSFKDIINALRQNHEAMHILEDQIDWLCSLIDGIAIYIEEFQLTWRDSVETICVMNISFDFLVYPSLDHKLVVKALKLVDISISKYMSPNLALLIDRTNDSTMAFIGPLLYAKLHDSSWEVRDSALEVLCTICHNANTKFPSFQKIVLDSELPKLVVHMSLNDGEGFVRATAVKCLREMIQVEDFWADLLKTENFHEKMINILQNETEGIVRTQAASLMCAIYAHQTFPNEIMDKVYDIMAHAATGDLHWEAKVKALDFWETVIKTHLCNQGMIDGSFPTVTFSKEHRKIVTLTEVEIRKRLVKVLNQLGQVGCLGVLMTGVQDDCDIEVSKNATRITQNFMELLRNYNIHTMDNLSVPMSPSDVSSPSFSSARSSVDDGNQFSSAQSSPEQVAMVCQAVPNAGSVLDNIVMSKDANLLTSIYSPGNVTTNDVQVTSRQLVTPNQFITFAQQDLEAYLNERKKWLTGIDDIGSLLDDILKDYDDQDVNSMDCY